MQMRFDSAAVIFPLWLIPMLVGVVAAHQGDEGIADAQHHNPIPLPWDHYGYRAVAFTLGIFPALSGFFIEHAQALGNHPRRALLINQPAGSGPLFPFTHSAIRHQRR